MGKAGMKAVQDTADGGKSAQIVLVPGQWKNLIRSFQISARDTALAVFDLAFRSITQGKHGAEGFTFLRKLYPISGRVIVLSTDYIASKS